MDKKVLVVDSNEKDRKELSAILQTKYPTQEADGLAAAKSAVLAAPMGFSVIFFELDELGRQKESFLAFLRGKNLIDRVPVILCIMPSDVARIINFLGGFFAR